MLWKAFVIAAETNGEVSLPLPSSQLGWERFLQGLPLLAASMDNEGHGLRAQTILLQMQLHWYAGMETQQPAPCTDQILEFNNNVPLSNSLPLFWTVLYSSGAARR